MKSPKIHDPLTKLQCWYVNVLVECLVIQIQVDNWTHNWLYISLRTCTVCFDQVLCEFTYT